MPPFAIIKELDVSKKAGSSFRPRFIIFKTYALGFQRMKKLSMGALSQQLPFLLMLQMMPILLNRF
jgi:hypothetical protein